jgi:hypothetical protein
MAFIGRAMFFIRGHLEYPGCFMGWSKNDYIAHPIIFIATPARLSHSGVAKRNNLDRP